MIAVDLLRGGEYFRHVVKRGENRGKPCLRATAPDGCRRLEPHEARRYHHARPPVPLRWWVGARGS